ncbi:MAG TPA: DUF4365 domain-containing protein [Pyrinomonadaceae bacterium]|jgi:hypothetical protein
MSEPDFLEPLPKADRNSELEHLSINALNSALPIDKFVFRDERINDAGVDGSLELKINSRFTNLRAQVQLKSTDSTDTNKDGSVSVQVTVANVNYLLNGQSPIYILFVAPRNELRFVWARDERKRLDKANPKWMQQEHVNIRFERYITVETIEHIHGRIQSEARLQRKITDTLSRASNAESLVISINPDTLSITDPDRARQILLSSGTLIVSAGYSEQIADLVRLLDLKTAQTPRILLVRAYAEYTLARYQSAYALLSEAMLYRDGLSADDQQFLDFLRDGCDHQLGRITWNELATRLDEQEQQQTGAFALSYQIEQFRLNALLNPDVNYQKAKVNEFHALVAKIINETNISEVFKLNARSAYLEVRGFHITHRAVVELGEARLKIEVGGSADVREIMRLQVEQIRLWESEIVSLIKDAMRIGHPILIAQTILQRAVINLHFMLAHRSAFRLFNIPVEIPLEVVQEIMDEVSHAGSIYSQANHLEGELRVEMIKADFYELAGHDAKAQEIARQVLPKAKAMGYALIVSHAEEQLSGQGLRSKQDSATTKKTEEEQVIRKANRSDEESRLYAKQFLNAKDLPVERLPVIEREYFSVRDVAREKINWCRHIGRLNDERHTRHLSTYYRTDPNRICVCNLHGFRSPVSDTNWKVISSGFKKIYCENCADRNPFQTQENIPQ